MRNVIRVTAVAGFFVFGIGGAYASDHTALWAQGGDDRAIEWSGSNSTVTGTVHSNGGLKVTGQSNSVTGATEWVTVLNGNLHQNQFDPAPVQVPAAPWPLTYDVADYQPGSSKALAAGAAYVDATSECASGNWQRVFQNVDLEPALYWIPCDVTFNAKNVTGQITIVSTGKVHLIAGRETHLESHTDGLLVLTSAGDGNSSDDDSDGDNGDDNSNGGAQRKVIHVTGARAELGGYLVAEYGEIHLAGSRQNLECGMFGRSIKISGSRQTIDGAACGVVANTPPVANPDEAATDEDLPVLINVLANDSDADGNLDPASVLIASSPANGTASVDAISGAVTYTPAPQFFGTDEFSYTVADDAGAVSATALVNIAVASVNDAPIGTADSATTAEDTGILIDVLLNDFDPDGSLDATSVIVVQAPVNGTTVVDPVDGKILYTPDADFYGDDPFLYMVMDDQGAESEQVLVGVTVTAVNDAPVADPDTATTPEDTAVAIDLLANDNDADDPLDPAAIVISTAPQFGTVIVDYLSGVATYTPDSDFAGDDSFSYTLTDPAGATSVPAQVSVTVTSVNDAPSANNLAATIDEDTSVSITLAGADLDGDPITFSVVDLPASGNLAGSPPDLTYTPASNFAGTDSFTYTASDGVDTSNLATVTITVLAINDPPFVVADDATTPEDTLVIIDVLANDGDVDGVLDPGSVVIVTAATQGTTSVDTGSGAISYTPSPNFVGDDSFTYTVADNLGAGSTTALASVTVTPVNDVPVAFSQSLDADSGLGLPVTLTGSDIDGDTLSFILLSQPQNGVLSGEAPNLTYTADFGFAGTDSFDFVVNDGLADSLLASIDFTVVDNNVAPAIISPAVVSVTEGSLYNYDVDATDDNGDVLAYSLAQAPAGATIASDTGLITWSPPAALAGHNLLDNPLCLLSQEIDDQAATRAADVAIIVDESGSMDTEHAWVGGLAVAMEVQLRTAGIGIEQLTNQYALVGFTDQIDIHTPATGGLGDFLDFVPATDLLRLDRGGVEDGYNAINMILAQLAFRPDAARNLILVTDEDRDIVDLNLDFDVMRDLIADAGAILNVAVDTNLQCGDGRSALGMGSDGIGYVADGIGGYTVCENAEAIGGFGTTTADYVDLAISGGGAAWDLNALRAGGDLAQSFSSALIDIKVQEILSQFSETPLPDLVVTALEFDDSNAIVTVRNRGTADVAGSIDVNLLANNVELATVVIPGLAANTSTTLSVAVAATGEPALTANVTIQEAAVEECFVANNALTASRFAAVATDPAGLFDSQSFTVTVTDVNESPMIDSQAPQEPVAVGTRFEYRMTASDPDSGDSVRFDLLSGPLGMTIDEVAGVVRFRPGDTQVGTHDVLLQATDLHGATATQSFQLTVDNSFIVPRFISEPDVRGFPSTTWTYDPVIQIDPSATAVFTLFLGPDGFQLDPVTGAMIWSVPANFAGESETVVIELQDGLGNFAIQLFYINNIPPVISSPSTTSIIEGDEFTLGLVANDPNQRDLPTWEFLAAPPGMTLNPVGSANLLWPAADVTTTLSAPQFDYRYDCRVESTTLPSLRDRVKWQLNAGTQTPVAGPLYDSDANGVLDSRDRVAVIAAIDNRMQARDARNGRQIWRNPSVLMQEQVWPAIVDVDNDAEAEIFAFTYSNQAVAFNADGSVRWISDVLPVQDSFPRIHIQVVDLKGDGDPELLYGRHILDVRGNLLFSFDLPNVTGSPEDAASVAADLNGDGIREVFFYNQMRSADGDLLWTLPYPGELRMAHYAVADFDGDGDPEFIVNETRNVGSWLRMFSHDGTQLWQRRVGRSGQLLIADFDSDGGLEIYGTATNELYDADSTLLWYRGDADPNRHASAADIDGDGDFEILRYEYLRGLRVIDGATGDLLRNIGGGTEYSVGFLTDLDGDGRGEILFGGRFNLRVYEGGEGDWMPGARVLSQMPYTAGAINEDLTVPAINRHWQTHNTVGVTGFPAGGVVDDGRIGDLTIDDFYVKGSGTAVIDVRNRGSKTIPGPVGVKIHIGSATGPVLTQQTLSDFGPNGTGRLFRSVNIDNLDGELFAVVTPPSGTVECETGNNFASIPIVRPQVTDSDGFTDTDTWAPGVTEKSIPPVVTSIAGNSATEGQQYTYQVTATDENRFDKLRHYLQTSPVGMSINIETGLVEWTPDWGQTGNHTVQIQVVDAASKYTTQSFTVTVATSTDPNAAPVIGTVAPTQAFAGVTYHYDVDASDADNHYLSYSLASAPAGMQQNALTGEINWIPLATDIGSVAVTTVVTDQRGATDTQSFTIVVSELVNDPPDITSTPDTQIGAGEYYSYQVVATDPDGDVLSYDFVTAPTGMTVSNVGLVEWAPNATQAGANEVAVRVTDSFGNSVTQTFTLNVGDPNRPPDISSTPSNYAAPGVEYTYQVNATDPDGDTIFYSLDTAPASMGISPAGLVTWTPAQTGSFGVAIRVADSFGNARIQSYSIVVTNQSPPQIISTAVLTATVGATYVYDVEASDIDGDTLQYGLSQAPSGMIIGSGNGVILWTPDAGQIGDHPVTVTVNDGRGGGDSQSYTLTVSAAGANSPPDVTSVPTGFGKDGFAYSYQVAATDPDGDTLSYQLLSAPAAMMVSATGLVEWTPAAAGDYTASLRISDAQYFVQQDWSISVAPADAVLAVSATVDPRFADPGQAITITTQVSGQAAPATITITVDGTPVAVDANGNAGFAASSTFGRHDIVVTADDGFSMATTTDAYYVRDPSDTVPPVVEILSPAYGDTITAPTLVVANLSDDSLVEWRLLIADAGSNDYSELASGDTPLAGTSAGSIDPTLLLNGFYNVVLEATDAGGNVVQSAFSVEVDGDMKIGHFSFTIEDLSTPVVGIPITVSRTYDTRRKHENLDFGYGWSIDYQNVRVQENRVLGTGWEVTSTGGPFPTMCIEPIGRHGVSVRLPDGELARYDMTVSPSCQFASPPSQVTPVFTARAGTTASLVSEDVGNLTVNNGELIDGTTGSPFDVSRYTLTTQDGFIYALDQQFGVLSVTDPNGNQLTYSNSGIVHSSGKAVAFSRDAQGRITAITDPAGNGIQYAYDAAGDLISVTNREAETTEHDYDGVHTLTEYRDPRGVMPLRNIYDVDGRLIRTIDADGNEVVVDHDLAGNTETITDRRGNPRTLVYDDEGNVLSDTNGLGETMSYTYDALGYELTVTDGLGNTTVRTVDAKGNVLTETDPLGHVTTTTYDARSNPLTITDANGNTQTMAYDDAGNLSQLTDALDNVTGFAWGTSGVLGTQSDALGNQTTFGYDNDGNRTRQTDALSVDTFYTFDSNGNELTETTTRTDEFGQTVTLVTTSEYDSENRLVTITDAEGGISRTEYNSIGKASAQIDPLGRRTEMTYDLRGNLITTTYPDGTTETASYDANGNEASRTDRNGNTTSFTYDAADRLTVTTLPDGATMQTVYDAAGRVIAEIDALNNRTDYTLDDAGRRTEVKDALNQITSFVYDDVGNLLSMTDARNNTTTYEYDLANRRTKTIFPDLSEQLVAYDALGRKVAETDQAGHTTQFDYDPLGRLITVTDALNQVTSYSYDEQGNKLTQTDAENRTTRWTYDNLGRVITRTLPLGQTETFSYDANGNVLTHVDFNGATTTFSYDINDRLIQKDFADATFEAWTHTNTGQVATETDVRGGVTTHTYDSRERLTRVDHPDGTFIAYTYDDQGNRTSLTTPAGTTSYSFDVLNRLETVTDPQAGVTTYGYDAVGNRASIAYPNGTSTAYTYDDLNRLTLLTHSDATSTLASFAYTLGAAGNRTRIDDHTGRTVEYSYDATYKLLTETVTPFPTTGTFAVSYSYDAVGNRLTKTVGGIDTTTYNYDDNDRLITEVNSGTAQTTTYSYDANGNTTQKDDAGVITTYTYDPENQLDAATTPSGTTSYRYDIDGMRTGQATPSLDSTFLLDKNRAYAQVLAEFDNAADFNTNGTTEVTYVYGDDLISQDRTTGTSYYHYDGLGSTRALTDQTGTITDTYLYEAFGELLEQNGTTPNNYLYTGEQYDANVGYYYLRARYYNQGVGRFSSMDLFAGVMIEPASLHKYTYVHNDPVRWLDPSGNVTLQGLATASRAQINLVLRTAGTQLNAIAGRNAITRVLFGRPPDSFGVVGHVIENVALNVMAPFVGSAVDTFSSAAAFGTAAHSALEAAIKGQLVELEPYPGVEIQAEVFFHEPEKSKSKRAGRREKGSIGIDILVLYEGNPVLGLDLKTGRGGSKKRNNKLLRRVGADIVEIKVEFF